MDSCLLRQYLQSHLSASLAPLPSWVGVAAAEHPYCSTLIQLWICPIGSSWHASSPLTSIARLGTLGGTAATPDPGSGKVADAVLASLPDLAHDRTARQVEMWGERQPLRPHSCQSFDFAGWNLDCPSRTACGTRPSISPTPPPYDHPEVGTESCRSTVCCLVPDAADTTTCCSARVTSAC